MDKDVLSYENINVIKRYCKDFNKNLDYGQLAFNDFLKWIYVVNSLHDDGVTIPMTKSIKELDNIWHTFLLFTWDYQEFCQKYFGKFIHHTPSMDAELEFPEEERRAIYKMYLNRLVTEFGDDLVFKWYRENIYS